ncbi:MAG: adenine nucleotide alpha hydrolase [bacterium]|nr:adenine nucleotide alpha hydrolase [Gammaproteobacteria bacterium]HIL98474.1 adenine nucleotide alpha hydrolase [Pseudomonadales bacterium]
MRKLQQLEQHLANLGPVAVAVSGGVDSMTLAVVAHRSNTKVEIFHAISPAVPRQATERVERYAQLESWQLKIIDAGEINDPEYIANPANRCYFCKTNLYDTVTEHTEHKVLSGTNLDDLGDYRPGLEAAAEHQVCHPYVDMQIDKATLRTIAKHLGLDDLHDLPAAPCLSSRVETGIAINPLLLPIINEAEKVLWENLQLLLPLRGVRCRIRQTGVAIEIESSENIDPTADYSLKATELVAQIFADKGFPSYTANIIIEPYQRGSAFLVETLTIE